MFHSLQVIVSPHFRACTRDQESHRGVQDDLLTVVPGHDGGHDQDTSEASLMKDVSLEHCKYYHGGPEGLVMLDVLVWRASSDEGFEQIAISEWGHSSDTKLDIGDISFLEDGGGGIFHCFFPGLSTTRPPA